MVCGIGLLIPVVEIIVVGMIDPPTTAPMSIHWLKGRFNPVYPAVQYHWVRLTSVSQNFLSTVFITEDQKFFQHWGFDWEEIRRACEDAAVHGKPLRGASTITQQCARSLFLWQGRSWFRKGLEAYYTIWMELLLSKHRIFELYVNVIELGDGVYGVDAAAQKYYRVPASQLTREEAAMLVAIMPDPKLRNPLQPDERVLEREETILKRAEFARLPEYFKP
jgi:monofunctional biosynthetic peptidoglycan transglycosylase